jgi:hypothetical protein
MSCRTIISCSALHTWIATIKAINEANNQEQREIAMVME